MQVAAVQTITAAELGFGFIADGLALVEVGGYVRLVHADRADNRLASYLVAENQAPAAVGGPVVGRNPGADILVQDMPGADRVFVFSSHSGQLRHAWVGPTGTLGFTNATMTDQGLLAGVTAMEVIERGATDLAVIAQRNVPGLRLFTLEEGGAITLEATLQDSPKSYLGDVADIAAVRVAGRDFVLTASTLENGLSLFEIDAEGEASFVDALGAGDGLPVGGPAALQSVAFGQTHYVVVAATISASISVIRVNDMGVMFVEDHMIDDRNTRFNDVAALDAFSHAGRAFVVTGGTDAGITVLELLPNGRLSHMMTHVMETGAGIGNVTGVETAVLGETAQVFLTDAGGSRVYRLEIDLASLGALYQAAGDTVTGSDLDDLLMGSDLADTLRGGAGDDMIHDGRGMDELTGGAGADVFVFGRDGSLDRITDFQDGIDRLDVSDWGRIYTASALTITQTAIGAVVSYGAESLAITRSGTAPLVLTDTDFIFLS